MTSEMMKSILLLLIAICLSTKAKGQAMDSSSSAESTASNNLDSHGYPASTTVYGRVQWICLAKVWVPNAMQPGDLIWGAEIAVLGYTLALLAFGVEWVLRRAQFA